MSDLRVLGPKVIARFRGEYKFLSNFADSPFEFEYFEYPTVEHAYQERKTFDEDRREIIRSAETPMEAARYGRSVKTIVRDGWILQDIKRDVMGRLVREKFKQNEELARKLIKTGDAYLIEGNYWHDNYFGVCTCKVCHDNVDEPKNWLGRILMDVRDDMNK